MDRKYWVIVFILPFIFFNCSKKKVEVEPIYTEEEFIHLTGHLHQLNPVGENAIPFSEYSTKVNKIISKAYTYERLRFYAVGFDSALDAKNEAIRLNQYYSKNYLFDQVQGEPVLEDMVITTFKAINPNKKIQRVPQKSHEKSNTHGEAGHEAHH